METYNHFILTLTALTGSPSGGYQLRDKDMDKYQAAELIKKILHRDYDRWMQYVDETDIKRSAYKQSFYVWKSEKGMIEEDADLIAELFS